MYGIPGRWLGAGGGVACGIACLCLLLEFVHEYGSSTDAEGSHEDSLAAMGLSGVIAVGGGVDPFRGGGGMSTVGIGSVCD